MKDIDLRATSEFGIQSLLLMENAGRGIADVIEEYFEIDRLVVLIVAGKGNNGGDGFVIARHLKNRGASVHTIVLGRKREIKGDARTNLEILERSGIKVTEITEPDTLKSKIKDIGPVDLVVDAIFGTGFTGKPEGIFKQAISIINQTRGFIIAVDIPSGVSTDDGSVEGEAIEADATVALCLLKRGHFLYPGRSFSGDVWIADIGIPYHKIEPEGTLLLLTDSEIQSLLPARPPAGNKGTFGKVLVLAGSRGYSGAAALTARAAQKIGAGLVRLGIPKSLSDPMESKLTEVIKIPLAETEAETFSLKAYTRISRLLLDSSVVALGPGIALHPETKKLVAKILAGSNVPVVLDADGLNSIAGKTDLFAKTKTPLVLTPHPGELARLIDRSANEIDKNRIEVATEVARDFKAVVVLKGAPTVIAEPGGKVFINPTGNSGLASGGTGDVLTGFIAGLIGQGLGPLAASKVGVYLHGLAADLAVDDTTEYALVASDLIDYLPQALKSILDDDEKD
jgi:NAD(P)H-hydrate epimerase